MKNINIQTVKTILKYAEDVNAAKMGIRQYCKSGKRMNKKVDDLIKKAFPTAYWCSNVGLCNKTHSALSGSVIIKNNLLFIHASNVLIKSNGWGYNRMRAWIIKIIE